MYNTTGIRDCKELREISQQRKVSQTARFRTKNALDVCKCMRVWEYIFYDEKSNLKTEIVWHTKHWTIDSDMLPLTLLWHCTLSFINTSVNGIDKGAIIVSENPRPQASHL